MNTISKAGIGKGPSEQFPPAVRGRRGGARYRGAFAAVVAVALVGYAGAALALLMAVSPQPGARVALVIGNGTYVHVQEDPSACNDAAGVGAALERLGFTVTTLEDAGYADMLRGLLEFSQTALSAQAAVVFYAGHGNAAGGRSFLIPVDTHQAVFNAADEGGFHVTEGNPEWIPVQWVMRSVEGASTLRLVILDTSVLAPLEPVGETMVALAAAVGTLASAGNAGSDHGPYTEALLRYLEEPGLEVGMLFRKVRAEVLRTTGGSQNPGTHVSLPGREVYLAPVSDPPDSTGEASVR